MIDGDGWLALRYPVMELSLKRLHEISFNFVLFPHSSASSSLQINITQSIYKI